MKRYRPGLRRANEKRVLAEMGEDPDPGGVKQGLSGQELDLRAPSGEEEWEAYYRLRWEVLRKPWGQARGSEQDESEGDAVHLMAVLKGTVIGVGRLHVDEHGDGRVRYMAVAPDWAGKGVGTRILGGLESRARERGIGRIRLNAREGVEKFYGRQGYLKIDEGPTFWGRIRHVVMQKEL